MQLYVQFIPVIAGTSDPAADPFTLPCPPDVEPDTVRSFLAQQLGEPGDIVWMSTPRHDRVEIGWVFYAAPATGTHPAAEFLCVPQLRLDDGSMRPMFEVQADQRQDFENLAAGGAFGSHAVVQGPLREYQHAQGGAAASGGDNPASGGYQASGDEPAASERARLDQLMMQLAAETGATLHSCRGLDPMSAGWSCAT